MNVSSLLLQGVADDLGDDRRRNHEHVVVDNDETRLHGGAAADDGDVGLRALPDVRPKRAAAPSISFDRDATGALVLDSNGNVKGGVRLSQFVAPTAAVNAINGTAFPCSVSGSHRYYTPQELKARYHTHLAYVAQVAAAALLAVKEGYELPYDAAVAVKDAAASSVAR